MRDSLRRNRIPPNPILPNLILPALILPALILSTLVLTFAALAAAAGDAGVEPAVGEADGSPRDELGPVVRLDQVGAGSLLFRTDHPGAYLAAPGLDARVGITVTGLVARARVEQRFHNPTAEWLEGVYAFPLPEKAAVDGLRMVIGGRVVEGEIRERRAAREVYEAAKAEGRKASLVTQERPNLFTTSVANIGPGEEIDIVIEYQEDLRYDRRSGGADGDRGSFQLRFPMVVGPRYIPGSRRLAESGFSGTGWAVDTDRVPDASRITPPVAPPGTTAADGGMLNPVTLTVELDPGLPLGRLESPSHEIETTTDGGRTRVGFRAGTVPADRDFVLEWDTAPGSEPQAALFTQELDGDLYHLLMVVPPHGDGAAAARLPRETIFVIDTSGSMNGTSIRQAREALLLALDRLHPEDAFNVIRFSGSAERLFPASRPAEEAWIDRARTWVAGLGAGGGTQMKSALELALADRDAWLAVRQVIFITDGSVGDEDELLAYIRRNLGDSRLFTVGIGSAPNSHFMERAAAEGRGTHTYIGEVHEVARKMGELFRKLESPVLHDIEVEWDDPAAETWPAKVGDLYLGEPVLVAARLPAGSSRVRLSGRRGDALWEEELRVEGGAEATGLDKLWARKKIAALMGRRIDGVPEGEIRSQVIEVALRHHLVSKYTSLVAVDVTPSAPDGVRPRTRPLPVRLPAGWDYASAVGGRLPRTATPAPLRILLGLLLLMVSWRLMRLARAGAR